MVQSSPTRGMWIEIWRAISVYPIGVRHPPHGGCGLKFHAAQALDAEIVSSPTRGMWIEIRLSCGSLAAARVIPHTGDVD